MGGGNNWEQLNRRIIACTDCPRLAGYLQQCRQRHPDWWCRPLPGFGDPNAQLLILGLAPGLTGANRWGRPFTGDASGAWLYRALHRFGWANRPDAPRPDDGLRLTGAFILNAVKCVPPQNRPTTAEADRCRQWLLPELELLAQAGCLILLGRVAHRSYLRALAELGHPVRLKEHPFAHGAEYGFTIGPERVIASYHPSRQNTQTGRLSWDAWEQVFRRAHEVLNGGG